MIHSFTPSGVEHQTLKMVKAEGQLVIHSFTPSGVEHLGLVTLDVLAVV